MAALPLRAPLLTNRMPLTTSSSSQSSRKSVVIVGESSSVNCQISKSNLSLRKKSSKRWQCMLRDGKSVAAVQCSASSSVQVTCSALTVRCSAEQQTQTIQQQTTRITSAPIEGKEKTPELDDGGSGGGPHGDDDGGGGGGGGGWGWYGGFFFFSFLLFLSFLKDQEDDYEAPYGE